MFDSSDTPIRAALCSLTDRPRHFRQWLVLLVLAGLAWFAVMTPAHAQDAGALLPMNQAFQLNARIIAPGKLELHWNIAPNYYLNRGWMKFTPEADTRLGKVVLPPGQFYHDKYLGDMQLYFNQVDVTVPYSVPSGASRLKLAVRYQGCHHATPLMCYPPHSVQLDLPLPRGAPSPAIDSGKR